MNKINSNIPSSKTIWIPLLILVLVYNIIFFVSFIKNKQKDNYNWNKIEILEKIKAIKILGVNRDFLQLQTPVEFNPDAKYTYKIICQDKEYFFSFEYRKKNDSIISFYDVHWLKGTPSQNNNDNCRLEKLIIAPIKKKGETVLTIGDEFLCRGYAEDFRKTLADKLQVNFIGNTRDVYNYSHQSYDKNSSNNILINIDKYNPDVYILFFKWHKEKESWEEFVKNLNLINDTLQKKNSKKVFWITIPYSGQEKNDSIYKNTNDILKKFKSDKIQIIESNKLLPSTANYDVDGVLKKYVYEKISKEIIDKSNANN